MFIPIQLSINKTKNIKFVIKAIFKELIYTITAYNDSNWTLVTNQKPSSFKYNTLKHIFIKENIKDPLINFIIRTPRGNLILKTDKKWEFKEWRKKIIYSKNNLHL